MKNKIKLFIGLGISLITTLIFTISSFAQAGYNINENGNIKSLNLWNLEQNYTITTPGYLINREDFDLSSNTYTLSFNFTGSSNIAQIQFYREENNPIYDNVFTITNGINTLNITLYTYTTKILLYTNAIGTYTNFMLNEGTTALDYFPYGNYTNNKNIGQNGQIYEQLNGTTAKLFQTNITNINTALNTQGIIEETININNQTSYTWNSSSIPTIENCIINYNPAINLSNRATILLQLKNATVFDNLTFTRIDKNEDRYIYLYNENKKLITTLTIARKVETITHII